MNPQKDATFDCSHSDKGLCSRCVLRRSFALSSSQSTDSHVDSDEQATPTAARGASPFTTDAPCFSISRSPSLPPVSSGEILSEPLSELTLDHHNDPTTPVAIDSLCHTSPADFDERRQINGNQKAVNNMSDVEDTMSPDCVPSASGWLRRLFDSPLCNVSIAMHYLNKRPTDAMTLKFLGDKLRTYPADEVDFYLPQLINLYINDTGVADAVHGYISKRCEESWQIALLSCWLLEAFGGEQLKYEDKRHGERLRQWILSLHRTNLDSKKNAHARSLSTALLSPDSLLKMSMRRSESMLGALRCLTPGNLSTGKAFDDGCTCFDESPDREYCDCETLSMRGEKEFITALTKIGYKMKEAPSKEEKSRRLVSELVVLNANLPARVWLPLYPNEHIVLRIPPTSGCVLNSKEKAPYCIYVEVLRCENIRKVRVPAKLSDAEAELYQKLPALPEENFHPAPHSAPSTSHATLDDRVLSCELASDTLSQKSMDSWNSEEKLVSAADISKRLKEWVKRPKKQMRHTPEDPSAFAMSEPWAEKRERLRVASPYGKMRGWDLLPLIVKTGDDLRQEMLAYQLLQTLKVIWEEEKVPVWLRPYKISVLSQDAGMIEPITNACSLHQIKRNQITINAEEGRLQPPSLLAHFTDSFGSINSDGFVKAQQNFVESCAAYSLVCYFLQVKDRHNGNILVDSDGHLIHIDFGFILSASPKNLGFETSPFKLTSELVDVMGGLSSDMFAYYRALMLQGLLAARKHHDRIMNIVEIMTHSGSPLACFRAGDATVSAMRQRFHMGYTEKQLQGLVDNLIEQSRDSLTTRLYDNFQYYTNGIF